MRAESAPWGLSIGGQRPQTAEDDAALHQFLGEVLESLEARYGLEIEWANASGYDLIRERRDRSNAVEANRGDEADDR